jgi:hypothetical protein
MQTPLAAVEVAVGEASVDPEAEGSTLADPEAEGSTLADPEAEGSTLADSAGVVGVAGAAVKS